jgi:Poly-beta-hydroxybutyrate polymerase N terminal
MTSGMTIGLSPVALTQAPAGWAQHLLLSPYEQIGLVHKAARKWARFFPYSIDQPLPQDKRFAGQAWQHWPFKAFYGRGGCHGLCVALHGHPRAAEGAASAQPCDAIYRFQGSKSFI